MVRDRYNVVPVTLALLLHALIFGALFVSFDFLKKPTPVVPLAITATIVTESAVVVPPPPLEREPEPLPEPEPEVVEPDPAEEARLRAEEQKRREDEARERERLQRIEEQKAEEERRRVAEEEARRKAEEEAELERRRQEAEEQRQRDIERQREANRREEERLLEQARDAEIAAEAERLEAMNSNEMLAYQAAIQQKVRRMWVRPATAPDNLECFVAIRQLPNGEVVSVQVQRCNGDDVVVRSIEVAVRKASPLPLPSNPILFLREFQFRFTIRD
ncbi:MAG: cell envelope integrity protein TolA [Woeseiaceae bacterium]|nr:cell envelope integrity protein TolA [Woeseiaceae bacterium]